MTTNDGRFSAGQVTPESDDATGLGSNGGTWGQRTTSKTDFAGPRPRLQVTRCGAHRVLEVADASSGPSGSVPGSLRYLAPEFLSRFPAWADEIVNEYGHAPCSRATAAAHEAAHAVIGRALGDAIFGAVIMTDGLAMPGRAAGWVGCTWSTCSTGPRQVTAREDASAVLSEAARNMAGIAGELAAGLGHPSSSLDELFKARVFSEAVAQAQGRDPVGVFAQVVAFCMRTVQRNRPAFDAIRGHLNRKCRLTKTEAERMLADVAPGSLL